MVSCAQPVYTEDPWDAGWRIDAPYDMGHDAGTYYWWHVSTATSGRIGGGGERIPMGPGVVRQ